MNHAAQSPVNHQASLSLGTKFGYAVGQVGISVPYNIVSVFLLFFFTNVAGVSPAFAGTIFMVAVLWAAVVDPFIGIYSDNLRTRYGRRRPVLLAVSFPYAIVTWLLFTSIDFGSDMAKNVYYIVFAILFFTAMTSAEVPFYSLGAEITADFDERTRIRAISSIFVYVAVLIAVNLPNYVTPQIVNAGGSVQKGWSVSALCAGLIAFITFLICWRATRGHERIVGTGEDSAGEKDTNIFKAFVDALKIKPVKFIVAANFLYLFGFSIFAGVQIYVLTYLANIPPVQQSMVMSVLPVATIVWLPIINRLSVQWGKKRAYTTLIGFIAAALLVFFLIGIYNTASMVLIGVIVALGNGAFWTLCFSMAYDVTEVDEWVNHKRREGILVAYMSFAQKIGTALAMWFSGLVLEYVGYVGTAQTQTAAAMSGLAVLFAIVPGVLILLSVFSVLRYPLTKEKHAALCEALQERKNGRPYDTSAFDDLL